VMQVISTKQAEPGIFAREFSTRDGGVKDFGSNALATLFRQLVIDPARRQTMGLKDREIKEQDSPLPAA
jgi:hypothetical protein